MLKIKNLVTGMAIAVTTASVLSVSSASADDSAVKPAADTKQVDLSTVDISNGHGIYYYFGYTSEQLYQKGELTLRQLSNL